jgi:hypothetical protein
MKWVLLIQICSLIDGTCGQNMQYPYPITSFYDCQRIAYDKANEWLDKMEKETVNENLLAYKAECVLLEPVDETPESKPRVHQLHKSPRHVLIFNSNQDPSEARYPGETPSDRLKNR